MAEPTSTPSRGTDLEEGGDGPAGDRPIGASAAPLHEQPGAPGRDRRRRHRGWKIALAVLVLLAAVFAFRVPILVAVARGVEVHQPPLRSDAIFLLAGDARHAGRAQHAATLYHRGFAPLVVLARPEDPPAAHLGLYPNDADVNVGILGRAGVPDSAILVITAPGGATSTVDEGRLLRWYLTRRPAERVLVVTNEYHTRRARWAMRRGLGDTTVELRMAGARDSRFYAGNWWRSEEGLLAYFSEYVKWGHNLLYR